MNKSEQRQLAELMARQDGIKVKSAMRRIQRAVKSAAPIKAPAGISRYAAQKFRKVVKQKRVEVYVKRPPAPAFGRFAFDRFAFDFDEMELLTVTGRFEMGSGGKQADIRDRKINIMVSADQAAALFNSGKKFESELIKLAPYLRRAIDVKDLELNGKNYNAEEIEIK